MRAALFDWFSNFASNRFSMNFLHIVGSDRFWRLSKEGFWIVFGQAAVVVGSLVGVRLLTELLDPASYGELALGMTVVTLVNQTILGPLGNGITRFYAPAVEHGDLGGYLKAVRQLVSSATGLIILMGLLTVACLLIAGRAEWIAISIAVLIVAILSGINSILSCIQNAARQRSIVALHQGLESWARFLVAAALMVWLGATSTVAMVGYAMGVILVLGSQYMYFRKIVPKDINEADKSRGWQEQIWTYSWPFSIFGMFTWMQVASDRWALGFFASTQEVGLYAVLFQLGYYPMSITTEMAMQFLAPIFFQRAGDGTDSRRTTNVRNLTWHLTRLALGVACAAFLVALFFHTQIFQVIVGKKYASVSHLLPWMLLAGGMFSAGQTMTLNMASLMKTQTMVAPKIVTALLGLAFNFAGAYWYGTTGIVIAAVLFSVLYFLWMAVLAQREGGTQCF